ncbi:MAG: UV DNA damage repair endonuclease UvsE [Candidatus Omnitrophica bacterium]|nr:UV DNA damage repair endonuclease UvsE [Candidatus Omnitrophota bacterium]
MIRWGLCCKFAKEPIRFRVTTAAALRKLPAAARQKKLSGLCAANARALLQAVEYCGRAGIGAFRVNSQIFPLKTHPDFGYAAADLPDAVEIQAVLAAVKEAAARLDVRLSFHPDQFVLLNSPRPEVLRSSLQELEYQAQVSALIGADVITLHAGGAYGDKPAALARLRRQWKRLPLLIRQRLALENDDRNYTPAEVLPLCESEGIPFVYDVHHHRCLPDGLSEEMVTRRALKTWNREPLFHISSPINGWAGKHPQWHHDFITIRDFPACWRGLTITVEVEAKAKEAAVLRLMNQFAC